MIGLQNRRCGTNSRYVYGCRCDLCKAAHAAYQREFNARRRKPPKTLLDRFMAKLADEPTATGCVLWTAALNRDGYGNIRDEQSRKSHAHRVAYELFIGPIPQGLTIDHLCRITNCVNPHHLEPVTSSENSRRMNLARRGNA